MNVRFTEIVDQLILLDIRHAHTRIDQCRRETDAELLFIRDQMTFLAAIDHPFRTAVTQLIKNIDDILMTPVPPRMTVADPNTTPRVINQPSRCSPLTCLIL